MINEHLSLPTTPNIPLERISHLENRWDSSLRDIQTALYPKANGDETPIDILVRESHASYERELNKKLLIGIAGPGAAGKGTLSRFATERLGFQKIINMTTRDQREGEVHGLDYYFTNEHDISTARMFGKLALFMERPGRGFYGTAHEEIDSKLSLATTACILEENPENILKVFAERKDSTTQNILLYILPKYPIIENSLIRLTDRKMLEADPVKRILTSSEFESTCGDRQIDEFDSLKELRHRPDITPVFIINDNLEETKKIFSTLFGDANAAA